MVIIDLDDLSILKIGDDTINTGRCDRKAKWLALRYPRRKKWSLGSISMGADGNSVSEGLIGTL